METWILIFILVVICIGQHTISGQLKYLSEITIAQSLEANRHHQEPNIFVPSAEEIATAIVEKLEWNNRIPENFARAIQSTFLDDSPLELAIRRSLRESIDLLEPAITSAMVTSIALSEVGEISTRLGRIEFELNQLKKN